MSEHRLSVLICYDGSEPAKHAIEEACRLFPTASGVVIHVWEALESILIQHRFIGGFVTDVDLAAADHAAQEHSAQLAAEGAALARAHGLDARARSVAERTQMWSTILDVADELGVDIIITGARGLTGMRELLIGSLTHSLLQHSSRPVLAIPDVQLAAARRTARRA